MARPQDLSWELVVVDNGSTDETPDVAESFAETLPVRRVFEPKAGLSNARNCGLLEARGDYVIWTDDDVEVEPDWLNAYLSLFSQWPDHAVFGGRSYPVFEEPKVVWFEANREALGDLLAVRDFGPGVVALVPYAIVPFGLNFAVRADVQRQFLYDPDLGVAPGRRSVGEETDVINRILKAGYSGVWSPEPTVRHIIPASRQTEDYVYSYYSSSGERRAEFEQMKPKQLMLFGVPVQTLLKLILLKVVYPIIRRLTASSWVRVYTRLAFHNGAVARWRRGF